MSSAAVLILLPRDVMICPTNRTFDALATYVAPDSSPELNFCRIPPGESIPRSRELWPGTLEKKPTVYSV